MNSITDAAFSLALVVVVALALIQMIGTCLLVRFLVTGRSLFEWQREHETRRLIHHAGQDR